MSLTKTSERKQTSGETEKKETQNDLFLNDFTETGTVRVGKDYQAVIPPLKTDHSSITDDHSVLLWRPPEKMSEREFYEFTVIAGREYNYTLEQALGFLQWHDHDIKSALKDLPQYVSIRDEWSVEDILVFEQAFAFNGKCFHRIQQMLPNKTMAALVKFYYSWKKRSRNETSYLEHCDKRKNASDEEEDMEQINFRKKLASRDKYCQNCCVRSTQFYTSPHGKLCSTCFIYFRRTGKLKEVDRKIIIDELIDNNSKIDAQQRKHKIPKNLNLNLNDFSEVVDHLTPGRLTPEQLANKYKENEKMQREIRQWRERATRNRCQLAKMRETAKSNLNQIILPSRLKPQKTSGKWSQHEHMLALQGFRMFGKKFHCISELIGTKTTDHVRSFYSNNRHKYHLDTLIKELEEQKQLEKLSAESRIIELSDDENDNNDPEVVMIDED